MKIADYVDSRAHSGLWSIRPEETLHSFASALRARTVGALTVLDDNGTLVGVVSERDLVAAFAEHGGASEGMTVADFMTRKVITCTPEDDMLETLELMNERRIRHIPVVVKGRPTTMISIREFDAACQELKELASTDALTGVPNRRHFMTTLDKEIQRHRRFNAPLAVAMLDLDKFKRINDNYGHDAGDDVLVWFARLLTKHFRTYDGIGRLGGEEFAVIFPNSDINDAAAACERLGRIVRREEAPTSSGDLRVTVSQGLTSIHGYQVPGRELLKTADTLLYEAKDTGRDRVVSRSHLTMTDRGVSFAV